MIETKPNKIEIGLEDLLFASFGLKELEKEVDSFSKIEIPEEDRVKHLGDIASSEVMYVTTAEEVKRYFEKSNNPRNEDLENFISGLVAGILNREKTRDKELYLIGYKTGKEKREEYVLPYLSNKNILSNANNTTRSYERIDSEIKEIAERYFSEFFKS